MAKQIGLGTSLLCSTDGTTTYGVTIGQVQSISGPALAADDLESTTLDSPSHFKTFEKGLIDLGELTFNVFWDGSTTSSHAKLHQLAKSRLKAGWKLVGPTTTYVEEFNGYVKSVGREIATAEFITASFGVKLSGDSTTTTPYSTTYST